MTQRELEKAAVETISEEVVDDVAEEPLAELEESVEGVSKDDDSGTPGKVELTAVEARPSITDQETIDAVSQIIGSEEEE